LGKSDFGRNELVKMILGKMNFVEFIPLDINHPKINHSTLISVKNAEITNHKENAKVDHLEWINKKHRAQANKNEETVIQIEM